MATSITLPGGPDPPAALVTADRPAVLFVCTGNAGRSQLAHALFRHHVAGAARVESAGVAPWSHLHPMAVRLLTERGIDVRGQYPKPVAAVQPESFDWVVTLGSPARARLPRAAFSAAYWEHWDLADPADADGTPQSEAVFRQTLAAIEARLPGLIERVRLAPRLSAWAGAPGIGTGLWATERLDPGRHLGQAARAGFRAIELNLYKGRAHFDWLDPGAVRRLRTAADDLGLLIWSIHAPDAGRATSLDPEERRRLADELRRCLELAAMLGARAVVSHALIYGAPGVAIDREEERLAELLADLGPQAEASPAQIAFENPGCPCAPGASAAGILARLAGVSRAAYGFALDTGHAHLDGDLESLGPLLGDQLVSLHLNDNDGRGDLHLPPGAGSLDWEAVARLLAQCRYRGAFLYEIEPGRGDSAARLAATLVGHRRLEAALDAWPGQARPDR